MEGSVPDSILIREIDALRAERDKAIADLEKIEPFLREREEFGQWQADALCRMLKIERGSETMSEFDLEARWVPFSEREPEPEKVVLVRESGGEAFGSVYRTEPEDDERVYIQNGEFYLGWEEVIDLEWLEIRERVRENE